MKNEITAYKNRCTELSRDLSGTKKLCKELRDEAIEAKCKREELRQNINKLMKNDKDNNELSEIIAGLSGAVNVFLQK